MKSWLKSGATPAGPRPRPASCRACPQTLSPETSTDSSSETKVSFYMQVCTAGACFRDWFAKRVGDRKGEGRALGSHLQGAPWTPVRSTGRALRPGLQGEPWAPVHRESPGPQSTALPDGQSFSGGGEPPVLVILGVTGCPGFSRDAGAGGGAAARPSQPRLEC